MILLIFLPSCIWGTERRKDVMDVFGWSYRLLYEFLWNSSKRKALLPPFFRWKTWNSTGTNALNKVECWITVDSIVSWSVCVCVCACVPVCVRSSLSKTPVLQWLGHGCCFLRALPWRFTRQVWPSPISAFTAQHRLNAGITVGLFSNTTLSSEASLLDDTFIIPLNVFTCEFSLRVKGFGTLP